MPPIVFGTLLAPAPGSFFWQEFAPRPVFLVIWHARSCISLPERVCLPFRQQPGWEVIHGTPASAADPREGLAGLEVFPGPSALAGPTTRHGDRPRSRWQSPLAL